MGARPWLRTRPRQGGRMNTPAYEFIPAQVRPQVANLLDRCMYCCGSGIEPYYGEDSEHMSACHACNGEGLTPRTDAAPAIREMYDALADVGTALDRTAWIDDVRPDSHASVRLSGKQIAAVRAAIAAAGTTPATATAASTTPAADTGTTPSPATNFAPSSLSSAPNPNGNSEGRYVEPALDGSIFTEVGCGISLLMSLCRQSGRVFMPGEKRDDDGDDAEQEA